MPVSGSRRFCSALLEETGGEVFRWASLGLALILISTPAWAQTRTGRAVVVDGDTLFVAGVHVRLLNMDAFESDQTCTRDGTEYRCGTSATLTMIGLISENEIRCKGDKRDRYNRPLVRCWVGDLDLAKEMVRAGWAISADGTEYRADHEQARRTRAGAWAGKFQNPADWRREHPR